MPKETTERLIQRHFAPLTSRSIFRAEIKTKGPLHSSRIVYPLTENLKPELPKSLTPKPPGEVGRISRNGYNLKEVLGWSKDEYTCVQKSMRTLAQKHLDTSQLLSKQKSKSVKDVYKLAKEMHPILATFEKDWVIDDFLGMILKNSATRKKAQGRSSPQTPGGSTNKDTEDEEEDEVEE
ncbi:hypothetical protein SCHPADRAFT_946722 [Schizopora paradoxa]|uniref:Uncharacterized protein n=1 Tax=Schizopora paradoxa TaxID=27342 RepID=A0A0H2R829_9AGAM|nr:hypothetical protein SCHPADRAFT_946722 [Schizopora paradoxa]